jgi:cell wall-associated NlpC family hydrolase
VICAVEVAPVRAEPRGDAEQVTQLVRGEPVVVEKTEGPWTQIRTAYDYPGWVETAQLGADEAPAPWPATPSAGNPVAEARGYLGSPYEWGGMTRAGIDCSGLVHMAYRRLGRLVPRDADQQEGAGLEVPEDELRAGDLITYGDGTQASHIAFWLGEGRILHASGREGVMRVLEEPEPEELRVRRRKSVRLLQG